MAVGGRADTSVSDEVKVAATLSGILRNAAAAKFTELNLNSECMRRVAHAGMGLTDDHMPAMVDFLQANPQLKKLELYRE